MSKARQPKWKQQLPNALSIARGTLAFAFPFLPLALRLPAIVFALASEFFDGFLARRWNVVSRFGQLADPIADKLFVLSTVIVLLAERRIEWHQVILIGARDITVAVGSFTLWMEKGNATLKRFKPRWSGKVATTFQFALLVALYVDQATQVPLIQELMTLTMIISSVSAIDYLYSVLHYRSDLAPLSHRRVTTVGSRDPQKSNA